MVWEQTIYVYYRTLHVPIRCIHARPSSRNEELTRSSIGGRERFFGDWWFKRWETINVWWGRQDPAPWTAIKCRHENRTQPVLIRVHEDPFFPFLFRGTLGLISPSSLSVRVIVEIMKLVPVLLLVAAIVFAAEEKKEEERPKTFRRLIPADVLRGEFYFSEGYFSFFLHERFWNLKGLCNSLQYVYLDLSRAHRNMK